MAAKATVTREKQPALLAAQVKTAPCVPAVRTAVEEWRSRKYKGASETTKRLLSYWFETDHRLPDGSAFQYHYFQREATETLIYLYEVAQIRRQKTLLETFAADTPELRLLQHDDFARYAIKMATGSGKTKVMALAVAWQYLNAVVERREDYAKTFLLIAPNIIVFDRLRLDFGEGRIFADDPVVPPELRAEWDFDVYLRGENERGGSQGALYLTNIQQFFERGESTRGDEPEEMTGVLGEKPAPYLVESEPFDERIVARSEPCLVVNDEAHHTHDEDSEWNKVIRRLHQELPAGLSGQLDFSATPRHTKGALFTWTVYDYPLKQAIIDDVVKRPMKGIAAAGQRERPSDIASRRYQVYLTAGVERWREYREQLQPLGKKPILFVMMNDTKDADDVADYLRRKYPSEFGGDNLLVIHTDRTGEVSKKDLDKARAVARQVDEAESPVNAIVSVLMLREGWDVQNVTVVVGLRPYTAKANILPEQAIGRGLRLMFRDLGQTYVERLDVIGNRRFIEFVEQLERDEDLDLETFKLDQPVRIVTIQPDESKRDKDIAIPQLTPILARKKTLAEEIASLDVGQMRVQKLPKKETDPEAKTFRYEGYDIIELKKLVEREYKIPEAQTPEEVISYYAKRIALDVKLPAQFAALVPKVREFLETQAFGERVELDSPAMIRAISSPVAQYVTVKQFAAALRALVIEESSPQLTESASRLSDTPPFPFSRPTLAATKTVFNLVACDNQFEREFADFLEHALDVVRFAKLPGKFGFSIAYTDAAANLRYYEPDFVVVLEAGQRFLVETKGLEDVNVAHKDRSALIWCENATLLTGAEWHYLKVPQKEYDKLQPSEFSELAFLADIELPRLPSRKAGVKGLIEKGEGETLEFKASARWDYREEKENKSLEKVIVKTVAAFLNYAKGGTLLIGVDDEGKVVGLEKDYVTLSKKPNRDGYELFLNNLLLGAFGKDTSQFVRTTFHGFDGHEVCQIDATAAARPIFVKDDKGVEQLYIRAGNQTIGLSGEEAWNYCRVRWLPD